MDLFIRQRVSDQRFGNTRPVNMGVPWYQQQADNYEPPACVGLTTTRHNASMETRSKTKEKEKSEPKKKKRKKEDGGTSDGSDSPCWSDYERTPGTKEGEKGSCRPEGSKKKKRNKDD